TEPAEPPRPGAAAGAVRPEGDAAGVDLVQRGQEGAPGDAGHRPGHRHREAEAEEGRHDAGPCPPGVGSEAEPQAPAGQRHRPEEAEAVTKYVKVNISTPYDEFTDYVEVGDEISDKEV